MNRRQSDVQAIVPGRVMALVALVAGLAAAVPAAAETAPAVPAAQLAATYPLFGPQSYSRSTGTPNQAVSRFPLGAAIGPFIVHIDNGGPGLTRTDSASVILNGHTVFGKNDFKSQQATLDATVSLLAQNELSVEVLGKPGSGFSVTVLATDTVAPVINATLSPPPDAAGWNRGTVTVTFTCTDAGSGVASCSPPATFAQEGAGQSVTGTAVDRAGNRATLKVTVNIDKTAPKATIAAPAGAFTVAQPRLAGTFSDALSGIAPGSLHITLDGADVTAQAQVAAGSFALTPATALAGGVHQAAVAVADLAGNSTQASASFTVDATAPTLAITAPAPALIYSRSAPVLALTWSDTGSGVDPATLKVTVDGTPLAGGCATGASSAACPLTAIGSGDHLVSATIADRAGNQAAASVGFQLVLDAAPPVITFVFPTEGSFSSPSVAEMMGPDFPTLMATLSDPGSGVDRASVRLLVDGADRTTAAELNADGLLFNPPTPLGEGAHTVEIDAADLAGNAARALLHFTYDVTNPTLDIVSPAPGGSGGAEPIQIEYSDALSGVAPSSLVVLLDGHNLTATCTVGAAVATCPPPALAPGTHSLVAQVFDNAGNYTVASVTLGAPPDLAPPSLTLSAPPVPGPSPALTLAYDDGGGSGVDPATLAVTVDGADVTASCVTGPVTATCAPSGLPRGVHTAAAQISDRAGNRATASAQFAVVVPVAVTFTSPTPEWVIAAPVVRVTGTVAPQAVAVTVNGFAATLAGGTFAIDALGLHEGLNNLVAVASDGAGNTGSATLRITADTTPPSVSFTSPADGAVVTSATLNATGLVNDLTLGTVNQTQATVTVNGVAATVANRGFVATGVTLAPGPNTLTAVATDRAGNRAAATVHVTLASGAGSPAIQAVSGDLQVGTISTPLGSPLVVRVTDAVGAPLTAVQVVFQVAQGDGTLTGGRRAVAVASDGQGQAATSWTLGSRAGAGVNRVRVTAVGVPGVVLFSAQAAAGPAAAINVSSGDNQVGGIVSGLSQALEVVVIDRGNNPVAGVPVTFQVTGGGGALDGGAAAAEVATDGSGLARVRLTLGPAPGLDNNLVRASLPGGAGRAVVFKASAFLLGDPAQTAIKGLVLDNQGTPVPGVTLRLRSSTLVTVSDAQGRFRLVGVPVGQVFLIADATTALRPGSWATLEYELFTLPGVELALPKPIYTLPVDVAHGIAIDEAHGGRATLAGIPGFALDVAPGSVTFPDGGRNGTVSVTAVHADRIPMPPGAGMQPRLIVTIQPAGARFNPPAAITFPNLDGLAPGKVTELFSFDHSIGAFVSIGTGTVSDDGLVVRSDPGFGVVQAGWHCGAPATDSGDSASLDVEIANDEPILIDAAPDSSGGSSRAGGSAPRAGGRTGAAGAASAMSATSAHAKPRSGRGSAGASPHSDRVSRLAGLDPTAGTPGGSADDIEADGSPGQDAVYTWDTSDASVLALSPDGGDLCADSDICTTTPAGGNPGEVEITVTLTSETTGDSAQAQKKAIVARTRILKVISEQDPGLECNTLPQPIGAPAGNVPMLMATVSGTTANISVSTDIQPASAADWVRIGVRQVGTFTILADAAAKPLPTKNPLSFDAAPTNGDSGGNLYEVVIGLDKNHDHKLGEDEVSSVFPQPLRVVTESDWELQRNTASSRQGDLQLLNGLAGQYVTYFLGGSVLPPGAIGGSVSIPSTEPTHPVGALWDSTCHGNVTQFSYAPSSSLAKEVAGSNQIQALVANALAQHMGEVQTYFAGASRPTSGTFGPWDWSGSVSGFRAWLPGHPNIAFAFGSISLTGQITRVTVTKGILGGLNLSNIVYNGSFEDLYDFAYNKDICRPQAIVQTGFSTLGARLVGRIFDSVVQFTYAGSMSFSFK